MFEWSYRGPRNEDDNEAVFTLKEPPQHGTVKSAFANIRPNRNPDVATPQKFEALIKKLRNEGQVTKVYVVNRVDGCPLAKLFVQTLVDHLVSRGLFAVYSERAGEF